MLAAYPHRRILVILLSSMLLLFWLEQAAVNAYWRQTFHAPSLLERLDALSPWREGGSLGGGLRRHSEALQQQVGSWDRRMIDSLNACCLKPKPSAQAAAAKPAAPKPQASAAVAAVKAMDPRLALQEGLPVLLAGDSMMQGVALHLLPPLFRQHQVKAIDISKQSTGLTYPDFFNWPATIERQLAANPKTQLLVMFVGANDTWDMVNGNHYIRFASPDWEQRYRERIRSILASAGKRKVKVLWLGLPNMSRDKLNDGVHYLNRLYREEVAAGGGRFISTRETLGSQDDSFNKFMTMPDQGEVAVRTADGVHFTRQGQLLLARRVLAELRFE
ncbi:SGNH family hydrolase [Chromobacterium violaceum]|uniref:SGNH/GDSL hydrolase family protein n=1 Tax=Chromobacterium violaceum TaxID=536 RepID=UPI0035A69EC2